ncbi:exo-beta-N-acetylmuramidase NamZ domain-containing protein [Ktedonospora formicarum]|uniref:DUF1343 domain-containing protein n=1 Tax=Ktedonospora formicarum TaxID=2778364 RepID=A0A8J3HUR0_9CHLR|nr:DUF1343 domain-containing protein [Ktedonospora formicarum]GHO42346.1 hypothetical protein KSX_05090 [Ktedonospora formicarum]
MTGSTRVRVQTGLDVLLAGEAPDLQGPRLGLITNPSGIDRELRSGIDLLHTDERFHLQTLFGPEHGIRGDAQAGVHVQAGNDPRTGLTVYSLYGETRHPSTEMLRGLDALVFDLQDVGVRYATYISTLVHAMEAAATASVPFVVLDRPNPLGGLRFMSNLFDPAFTSFVGIADIPICHGLTVGEFALLYAAEHDLPEPRIIKMQGWRRELWFDQLDLPWVLPSPNLPTLEALALYPATCLVEGISASEGRGTTRPFEFLGAPDINPFELADTLARHALPGVAFRPLFFTPTFQKHAQQLCGGVQVYLLEREHAPLQELGLHLIADIRRLSPLSQPWIKGKSGNEAGRYFIDLLLGSDKPRLALDAGASVEDITAGWHEQTAAFERRRVPYLLY